MKIILISDRNDFVLFATKSLNEETKLQTNVTNYSDFISSNDTSYDVLLIDEEINHDNLINLNKFLTISNATRPIANEVYKIIVRSSSCINDDYLLDLGFDQIIDLNQLQGIDENSLLSLIQEKRLKPRNIIRKPLTTLEEEAVHALLSKFKLDLILTGAKHILDILSLTYNSLSLLTNAGIDALICSLSKEKEISEERIIRSITHAIETSYYFSDKKLYEEVFFTDKTPDYRTFIIGLSINLITDCIYKTAAN